LTDAILINADFTDAIFTDAILDGARCDADTVFSETAPYKCVDGKVVKK